MLLDIERSWEGSPGFEPEREVTVRRHIGDYTLFMTGVFRERVERVASPATTVTRASGPTASSPSTAAHAARPAGPPLPAPRRHASSGTRARSTTRACTSPGPCRPRSRHPFLRRRAAHDRSAPPPAPPAGRLDAALAGARAAGPRRARRPALDEALRAFDRAPRRRRPAAASRARRRGGSAPARRAAAGRSIASQRGVTRRRRPTPRAAVVSREPERPARAWLSGIDGSGSRAVWILFEGGLGGGRALLAHRQRRGRHLGSRRRRHHEASGSSPSWPRCAPRRSCRGSRSSPRARRPRGRGARSSTARAGRSPPAAFGRWAAVLRGDRAGRAPPDAGRRSRARRARRPSCSSCPSWRAGSSTRGGRRATRSSCWRRVRAGSWSPIRSRPSARRRSRRASSSARFARGAAALGPPARRDGLVFGATDRRRAARRSRRPPPRRSPTRATVAARCPSRRAALAQRALELAGEVAPGRVPRRREPQAG